MPALSAAASHGTRMTITRRASWSPPTTAATHSTLTVAAVGSALSADGKMEAAPGDGGLGLHRPRRPGPVVGTEVPARCLQHETDHLDGVLFSDRMDAATRKLVTEGNSEHQSGVCR